MARSVILLCVVLATAPPASGQDWPRFRGPNGTGIGRGDSIPAKWTPPDYNWKVKLPGTGHGSPAIWKDRIFLMCCNEDDATRIVVCLNPADGSVRWTRSFKAPPEKPRDKLNALNSYAATTPAVDERRLYVSWSGFDSIVLRALDHEGKDVWSRDLGPHKSQHGPCTSPMLLGQTVVMTNDQQGDSSLIAVAADTGKTLWQLPRRPGNAAYSTPCVFRPPSGAAELIVTSTAGGVTSVHPKTGRINWELSDACPQRCVSSPVVAAGLIVATNGVGSRGKLIAVRPPASGGQARVAYRFTRNAPYVPCPLPVGGRLFLFGDTGYLTCLEAATGKRIWQERVRDRFFGSPVCVGGRIYCISRKGTVYVVAAGDKYKLLAANPLGEKSHATPAVAGGRMYLRTHSHLISIGGKLRTAAPE